MPFENYLRNGKRCRSFPSFFLFHFIWILDSFFNVLALNDWKCTSTIALNPYIQVCGAFNARYNNKYLRSKIKYDIHRYMYLYFNLTSKILCLSYSVLSDKTNFTPGSLKYLDKVIYVLRFITEFQVQRNNYSNQ